MLSRNESSEFGGSEMCTAHEFRTIAENQRRLAALSDFPWLRDRYLASADKWDVLAQAKSLTEVGEPPSLERPHPRSQALTEHLEVLCRGDGLVQRDRRPHGHCGLK